MLFVIRITVCGHDCFYFGHGNSNKLVLCAGDPLLAKALFQKDIQQPDSIWPHFALCVEHTIALAGSPSFRVPATVGNACDDERRAADHITERRSRPTCYKVSLWKQMLHEDAWRIIRRTQKRRNMYGNRSISSLNVRNFYQSIARCPGL